MHLVGELEHEQQIENQKNELRKLLIEKGASAIVLKVINSC